MTSLGICPACGSELTRRTWGNGTVTWCPRCQMPLHDIRLALRKEATR